MYPYQRTPMRNPYLSPITWVFMGKLSPRIPREHNKYYGYTVRGTPNYKASYESTQNFMGLSEDNLEEGPRADRLSIREFLKPPYNSWESKVPPPKLIQSYPPINSRPY